MPRTRVPVVHRARAAAIPLAAASLAPALARAADAGGSPDAGGLVRATLGLVVVLAVIFAVGWLMRRLAPAGRATGALRIVGAQALGTRERVVVLEVGEQWIVVGVAPGSVRGLATLPRGVLPAPPETAATTGFAAMLAKAVRRPPAA